MALKPSPQVAKAAQRLCYRMVTERLQRLARDYAAFKDEGRLLDFVRSCRHNITL